MGYYHDDKELNFKIFKAKAAHVLNDLDDYSKNVLAIHM